MSSMADHLLWVFVILWMSATTAAVTRTVDVKNGQDSSLCFNNSVPCKSLEYALNNKSIHNDTHVLLKSADIALGSNIRLEDLINITIEGSCNNKPVINCSGAWTLSGAFGAGFSFYYVTKLTFHCVELFSCGSAQTYENGSLNTKLSFRSAIFLQSCMHVAISNIHISNSNGIGLTLLDAHGNVQVSDSHFYANRAWLKYSNLFVGHHNTSISFMGSGAIHLEVYKMSAVGKSTYIFNNCSFYNNSKPMLSNPTAYPSISHGAGLMLKLGKITNGVFIEVSDCKFWNNVAGWGGGMFIGLVESVSHNNISVLNSSFVGNKASYQGGGGIDIGLYYFDQSAPVNNNVIFFGDCVFEGNTANYGGGMTIFLDLPPPNKLLDNSIMLSNCTWIRNSATRSAAVDVSPNVFDNLAGGFQLVPLFIDTSFINNYVTQSDEVVFSFSYGTFVVTAIDVEFKGTTRFENNNGTALQVVSSRVIFATNSVALFFNNSGYKGGAVALVGLAYFQFNDSSSFHFTNNSALLVGGAVYSYSIDQHDYFSSRTCFFRYSESRQFSRSRNVTFSFTNNMAEVGHSIFATTMRPCWYSNPPCAYCQNCSAEEWLNCSIGNFVFDNFTSLNIATIGRSIVSDYNSHVVHVIPGKEISLNPVVFDEFNNTVSSITIFHTYLVETPKTGVKLNGNDYSPTATVKLSGNLSDNPTELLVQTNDILGVSMRVNVLFSQCPPGFQLTNDSFPECRSVCENYQGLTKCEKDTKRAYIMQGFWVGYLNNDFEDEGKPDSLYSSSCPPGYCVYNDSANGSLNHRAGKYLLPGTANRNELDRFICGSTRTGTLCGECQENHSVGYHSKNFVCLPDTWMCNCGVLLYIASDLLPLTLLFLAVLVLDISFTSGAANGFILFAQVIDLMSFGMYDMTSRFEYPIKILVDVYQVIYGFFNLSLDSPSVNFCLWKGAGALDVMVVKYATTTYALLLVLCVVLMMDYCNCHWMYKCLRKRKLSTSIVHGLTTFLVMCYSQCVRVTFEILRVGILSGENKQKLVVYRNGNYSYLSTSHLPYATLASVFLILLVIPLPTVLFLTPILIKLVTKFMSESTRVKRLLHRCNMLCLVRLKPVFDSFQGCYKDSCRCFAGLYLLYRVVIVTAQILFGSSAGFYIASGFVLIFFLAIHCIVQPYQEPWHNVVDTLIFCDLVLVNYTSLYGLTIIPGLQEAIKITLQYVQLFLIYLPIICFVCYIMYKAVKKTCKSSYGIKSREESDWPYRLLDSDEGSMEDEPNFLTNT